MADSSGVDAALLVSTAHALRRTGDLPAALRLFESLAENESGWSGRRSWRRHRCGRPGSR